MKSAFGDFLRGLRLAKGYTLRSFSQRFGYDTAYISRLENDKMKPPSGDKLVALASSLGLREGSSEWVKFFDLAHQAKDELPSDIKGKAHEVIAILPAFLRTPDGKKIDKKRLNKLIAFLKDSKKEK